MNKELKVYLDYNSEYKGYSIVPRELKAHYIEACGTNVVETVEELITLIDDVLSFESSEASMVAQARDLTGLLLEIVPRCEVTAREKRYIDTVNLMMRQHRGQTDKAGKDYYFHPMRVSTRVATVEQKIVALLHDTIEDTGMTPGRLSQLGYSHEVVTDLLSVTRAEGESYAHFIVRVGDNETGRLVKLADLEDNMDIRRLRDLGQKDWHRLNKYLHAYRYLNEGGNTPLIE